MLNVFKKLFGSSIIKDFQVKVERINNEEPGIEKLSDTELKEKSLELRARAKTGESLDELLPLADRKSVV